jgi:hypothetical protein
MTEWVVGDAGLDISPEETAGLLRAALGRATQLAAADAA